MPCSRLAANYAHDSQLNTRTKFTTRGLGVVYSKYLRFLTASAQSTLLPRSVWQQVCAVYNDREIKRVLYNRIIYEFNLTLTFFFSFFLNPKVLTVLNDNNFIAVYRVELKKKKSIEYYVKTIHITVRRRVIL